MTNLLDVLKETDFRVGFTDEFPPPSPREVLARDELQKRLLLCLYGLGTNTGLKRVRPATTDISHKDLLYVRRRFVRKRLAARRHRPGGQRHLRGPPPRDLGRGHDRLRLRLQEVRGLGPEPDDRVARPLRRPGRDDLLARRAEVGVHLLAAKRCSSSEVAAMIEGVLRHCTEMAVEKSYVDSHGQSEVAFAFCHLLGFELLPRLKAIARAEALPPGGRGRPATTRACGPSSRGRSTGS